MNNYKDNLNFLYRHPDMMLTVEWALRNIIVCVYAHYIDTWVMNGACVGHCAVLMHNMLSFAMHLGWYRCCKYHYTKEYKRKGIPKSMPLPVIDVGLLLTDKEENLKLEQIRGTHPGIPGSPLYVEPLSMTKHFDAMIIGKCGCCKDSKMTTRVYKEEARQACQKILRCLDMRVLDGDIMVPTCLHMPTLILPHQYFQQLYYDLDNQGCYASRFPTGGQGFLQPRGDIRTYIVPTDFRVFPTDVQEAIDAFHG